jgi:hypothetical protein
MTGKQLDRCFGFLLAMEETRSQDYPVEVAPGHDNSALGRRRRLRKLTSWF